MSRFVHVYKSLWLLVAALPAFAQPAQTTISDVLYNADGTTFTGPLSIQSQTFASNGSMVLQNVKNLRITNGVLNVSLAPNDTATPRTKYVLTFGTGAQQDCTIPTSASPIKLVGNCVAASGQALPAQVALSSLNGAAYSDGNYCITVLHGVITLSQSACPGGGSSGALSWSGMTLNAWSNMTLAQWSSLTN